MTEKAQASATMAILETPRLALRSLSVDDAAFYLRLVNEPSWLQYIGDKGVRSLDDARAAISTGPVAQFERLGFSHYMVERKEDGVAMGLCGLIKREALDDIDIGYAFLPEYWGRGYAFEAASAVLEYGNRVVGLPRIVAIVSPDNHRSSALLEKMGLKFERTLTLKDNGEPTSLFGRNF
jgi:RimJ/RimL family protein N-acetyltransferase